MGEPKKIPLFIADVEEEGTVTPPTPLSAFRQNLQTSTAET
jgi:hypothetical protein